MGDLSGFEQGNGPPIGCKSVSDDEVLRWSGLLPDVILQHWKSAGRCGYAEGAFWFVNPDSYASAVSRLDRLKNPVVFGRTAFADLFLWSEGQMYYFTPEDQTYSKSGPYLETYFNVMLCEKTTRASLWRMRTFKSALKRLGPLGEDECYGYVPLPALGGSGKSDTLKKVKILPYLEIVRQSAT